MQELVGEHRGQSAIRPVRTVGITWGHKGEWSFSPSDSRTTHECCWADEHNLTGNSQSWVTCKWLKKCTQMNQNRLTLLERRMKKTYCPQYSQKMRTLTNRRSRSQGSGIPRSIWITWRMSCLCLLWWWCVYSLLEITWHHLCEENIHLCPNPYITKWKSTFNIY